MATPETYKGFLGKRFEEALLLALRAHADQSRKGTAVPYAAHLLSVCALVLEDGGDEDEAIAALLHDALEDQPDRVTREQLEEYFGPRVKALVELSTDTPADYTGKEDKGDWGLRKAAYLERLRKERYPECRVALADKLHNLRSIARDHRQIGAAVWQRFNKGREEQLQYYRKLVEVFRHNRAPGHILAEMENLIGELEGAGPAH